MSFLVIANPVQAGCDSRHDVSGTIDLPHYGGVNEMSRCFKKISRKPLLLNCTNTLSDLKEYRYRPFDQWKWLFCRIAGTWRVDRVAEGAGLLNQWRGKPSQEFESLTLLHFSFIISDNHTIGSMTGCVPVNCGSSLYCHSIFIISLVYEPLAKLVKHPTFNRKIF